MLHSPRANQTQDGVMTLEKVVPSVQVIVSLPFCKYPTSHVTVTTVPLSTGNISSVLRFSQTGSRPLQYVLGPVMSEQFKGCFGNHVILSFVYLAVH